MDDSRPKTLYQSVGNYQDFRVWLTDNKLQALGGAWLTAVAGSFGIQMLYDTPMTLKVFQTRIYAQAFTLAALCGAAAISITEEESKDKVEHWEIIGEKFRMAAAGVAACLALVAAFKSRDASDTSSACSVDDRPKRPGKPPCC